MALAQKAVAEGRYDDAMEAYGAMIRKASKARLYDVEAEHAKFVTLYLNGRYNEAVQRCVRCLDAVKLLGDRPDVGAALPTQEVTRKLERYLLQAMVMRGDSVLQLTRHLWKVYLGEYYLSKKPRPFLAAFALAWQAQSTPVRIAFENLREELAPYTAFLLRVYEDAGAEEVPAEEEGSSPGAPSAEEAERRRIAVLVEAVDAENPSEKIDAVLDVAEAAETEEAFVLAGRLADRLPPGDRMRLFAALGRNKTFREMREVEIRNDEVVRLRKDLGAFFR